MTVLNNLQSNKIHSDYSSGVCGSGQSIVNNISMLCIELTIRIRFSLIANSEKGENEFAFLTGNVEREKY